MHREELPSWINPQSNLVLIGDSCHPMLPYLAQGANSSIEDGAVLGLLLSPRNFTDKSQLPVSLKKFEKLRKARGEGIVRKLLNSAEISICAMGPSRKSVTSGCWGNWGKSCKEPSRVDGPVQKFNRGCTAMMHRRRLRLLQRSKAGECTRRTRTCDPHGQVTTRNRALSKSPC